MLGNPLTDEHGDDNSRVEFSYRKALISDQLYEVKNTQLETHPLVLNFTH